MLDDSWGETLTLVLAIPTGGILVGILLYVRYRERREKSRPQEPFSRPPTDPPEE